MSEEANVTFVGGKAVEQHLEAGSSLEPDEHAEARAAVKKAIEEAGKEAAKKAKEVTRKPDDPAPKPKPEASKAGKQSVPDESPERGADGKFVSKKPAKADADEADEESDESGDGEDEADEKPEKAPKNEKEKEIDVTKASVKELLKNRERVANLKKSANEEISAERQKFEAERLAFQQQQYALAQQRAEIQRQAQIFAALKKDPARAVREAGYDPEQFILDLAQEGTPEGKMARQLRETQAQLQQMQQWQQNLLRQQQVARQQLEGQQRAHYRQNVVQDFVKRGMDESKYPHVAAFYKGRERSLIADGDLTAEEYRHLSGGKEGQLDDILDYIEDQLAERFKGWYSKSQKSSVKKTEDNVDTEKPKSKGKSLSPDASSERRALKAKSLKDLDGDERLEAAKQAVAVALANSGKNKD